MTVRSFFRIRNFRCQVRNQRPKRHKNGWCSHRIAEKMVITTRPTVATARGTTLKPVQHSLVFREYNMSQRSSTAVNLQPIYEAVNTYFTEFYFIIPGSRNLAKKSHFAAANSLTLPTRKMLKLIFKSYICDH